jgi:hypothetical protein
VRLTADRSVGGEKKEIRSRHCSIIAKGRGEQAPIGGWLVLSWIHIEDLGNNFRPNVWILAFHEPRYLLGVIRVFIVKAKQTRCRPK